MITKKCVICDSEFITWQRGRKYCSDSCSRKSSNIRWQGRYERKKAPVKKTDEEIFKGHKFGEYFNDPECAEVYRYFQSLPPFDFSEYNESFVPQLKREGRKKHFYPRDRQERKN